MMKTLLMMAVFFASASAYGQMNDVKEIDGFVATHPASVISIDDVVVVEEFVGEESVLDSYLIVEVTGVYESHGEEDVVMVKSKRTDDGRPFSYQSYKLELTSVTTSAEPVPLGGGAITAVSNPRPFKVQFKVRPFMWDGNTNWSDWDATFSYNKYQPVFHQETRGFSARLVWMEDTKKWVFHKVGFPFNP